MVRKAAARRTGLAMMVCLMLPAAPAMAQEPASPLRVWAGAGLGGGGGAADVEGLAFLAQLAGQKGPHQLTFRFLAMAAPFDDGGRNGVVEAGLLYGRTTTGYMGHASLSAGLAATDLDECPDQRGSGATLGIPIVADAALRLFPVAGLGAQAYLNLNRHAVYGGVAFYLQLGWLPRGG